LFIYYFFNILAKISARRNRLTAKTLEAIMFLYETEDLNHGIDCDDDEGFNDIEKDK